MYGAQFSDLPPTLLNPTEIPLGKACGWFYSCLTGLLSSVPNWLPCVPWLATWDEGTLAGYLGMMGVVFGPLPTELCKRPCQHGMALVLSHYPVQMASTMQVFYQVHAEHHTGCSINCWIVGSRSVPQNPSSIVESAMCWRSCCESVKLQSLHCWHLLTQWKVHVIKGCLHPFCVQP